MGMYRRVVADGHRVTRAEVRINLHLIRHHHRIIGHLYRAWLHQVMVPYLTLHWSLGNTVMVDHTSRIRVVVAFAPLPIVIMMELDLEDDASVTRR